MQRDTASFDPLDLTIDRDAEVPIGVQIAWALRTHIRDGSLLPGQRLPGLRELAQALGINPNTVRAVYQRLEHEGIIESQRGSGTFVTTTAQRPSAAGTIAANAAREAYETGIDPREIAATLYVQSGSSPAPGGEQVERRRRLRTQIAVLERTLAEIEVAHPGLVPAQSTPPRGRGPRLLDTAELEQVQTYLIRRLAAIQVAIDERDREQAAIERQTQQARSVETAPKRVAKPRASARPAPTGA
jgi:DNA-binding transcriptional regulator YhcF (GntR family)